MVHVQNQLRLGKGKRATATAILVTVFVATAASPSSALSIVHPRSRCARRPSSQLHPTRQKCSISRRALLAINSVKDITSSHEDEATAPTPSFASSTSASTTASQVQKRHKHTLAILTMPHSASARIANEAILETAISITSTKLSVVLRTNTGGSNSKTGEDSNTISLTQLRRYAGEVYSMAWDAAFGLDERDEKKNNINEEDGGGGDGNTITSGETPRYNCVPPKYAQHPPGGMD